MSTTPDYELLKDAHAIIDGIPDAAIAFGKPCAARGRGLDDGTVCSPEGWLALHPTFTALGLAMPADDLALEYNGELLPPVSAMARVFRLPEDDAARLFGERDVFSTDGAATQASDKQLWLTRARHYIHDRAFTNTVATMVMAPVVTMAKITDAIEGEPK